MKNISKIFFFIFVIQILTILVPSKNIFPGLNYLLNISSVKAEIPRDFFSNAIDKKNKGDLKNAIIELNKLLDINPLSIKAIWLRGTIYFDLKEYEKAINDFNNVIKSDTNDYEKLLKYESLDPFTLFLFYSANEVPYGYIVSQTRGLSFDELNNLHNLSLYSFGKKVDGLNLSIMALEKRGISKFFLEDYGGAVRDLLFVDMVHGISPSSNKTLAISLFETKFYNSAIQFFEKAIEYEPSASLYEQLGKSKVKTIEKGGIYEGHKAFRYCADFINAELLGSNSARKYYIEYCKNKQPCITVSKDEELSNKFCKKEDAI